MTRVITGDAFDVLADFDAESVHAIVTDPPYGLAFMGRDWDTFDPVEYQAWCEEWARLALDVLKPGGHLLAFSGNRTHHRLFSGVEDAGFEVRDTLTWHYGSGFPKALDVGKQMDKYGGNPQLVKEVAAALKEARESRDITKTEADERFCGGTTNYTWFEGRPDGTRLPPDDTFAQIAEAWPELEQYRELVEAANREVVGQSEHASGIAQGAGDHYTVGGTEAERYDITSPATDAAKRWDGWKTALKPATEFIVLARKPFSGTVAENVQAHGTGALNIGESRIGTETIESRGPKGGDKYAGLKGGENIPTEILDTNEGRYPANVIFDADAAEALDREVGETVSTGGVPNDGQKDDRHKWSANVQASTGGLGDKGGPSRYFYTSKATRAERTLDGRIENAHPTVKPVDLMEWLIKLVTAEGQTVLDPFAGTGTTGRAAKNLGRDFILIERNPKWADVARVRCGLTPADPAHLRDDDGQAGIEAFTGEGSA